MRALLLILPILLLSTAVSSTPPGTRKSGIDVSAEKALLGGWSPIQNIGDPHVRKIAEFAVKEHNKQANAVKLTLGKIVRGETQVVAGTKYRLVVVAAAAEAAGRASAAQYEAVVWERSWQNFIKLLSFDKIKS